VRELQKGAAYVRRRPAVFAAKRSIEIGQIPETDFKSDVGDFPEAWCISQQLDGRRQPSVKQVLGKGLSGRLEQAMNVASGNPETAGGT
jgi:hypothetical protein